MDSGEKEECGEIEAASASRTERRISEAFEDLPEPYAGNRPWRSPRERAGRYVEALRRRLDQLVRLEKQQGDEQKAAGFNRAERNALTWALEQLAPVLQGIERPPPTRDRKSQDLRYVSNAFDRIAEFSAIGFTRVDRRRPGWLLHKSGDDIAPVETSLTIWFYFAGVDGGIPS